MTNLTLTIQGQTLRFGVPVPLGRRPLTGVVEAVAVVDTPTASPTDELVDSMSITPPQGSYLVSFTGSVEHSAAGDTEVSVYAGGVQDAASERRVKDSGAFACSALVTVNGSQAIEGQWRTSAPTATMHERHLVAIPVA